MTPDPTFVPVKSDVDDYLSTEKFMFDNDICDLFKQFRIALHLKSANITKHCGHKPFKLIFDLFMIPFLMVSTVHLFVRHQYQEALDGVEGQVQMSKNPFYRLLENAKYNWRIFLLNLSFQVYQQTHLEQPKEPTKTEESFIIDDTVIEISGKLIELASYVFDHSQNKSVLGFSKVALGIFNSQQFMPIGQRVAIGKKRPKAKSKATKYKKRPKADRIDPNSPGAIERQESHSSKLELAQQMLEQAIRKGFQAKMVMFDSWYCFNSFIITLNTKLNLHVICQLKNMPRVNKYIYKDKIYSLKELYTFIAKPKMRAVKKYQFKQAALTVSLPDSDVKMKIVFIQNDGQDKWHAFGATNNKLSAKKILADYSQRWSIEVFFKNIKQYLNYGKEQVSNFDSMIASDAIAYLRYCFLTYLAFKVKSTFYDRICSLRKQKLTQCFGVRLLIFFLDRIKAVIQYVCNLIEHQEINQALEVFKVILNCSPKSLEFEAI